MKTQDIIRQDMQQHGIGNMAEKFLQGLAVGLQKKELGILRESETVVIFKSSGDHALEFHVYTADSPIALTRAFKKFYAYAKNGGVEFLESKTDNINIVKLAQSAGIPVKAYKLGSGYQVEIEVQ